jgi:adenosylcobyric acid synthase
MADLMYLKRIGLAQEIIEQAHRGKPVIGICGGYQMLGEMILDPEHVESAEYQAHGLGLLPVTTTFFPVKSTHQVRACVIAGRGLLQEASGLPISGYEIHMGTTNGANNVAPFRIDERSRKACQDLDGCLSADGNVLGTYLHGLFHNEALRRSILSQLAARKNIVFRPSEKVLSKEEAYNRLADVVRGSLDMELIYRIIGLKRS